MPPFYLSNFLIAVSYMEFPFKPIVIFKGMLIDLDREQSPSGSTVEYLSVDEPIPNATEYVV